MHHLAGNNENRSINRIDTDTRVATWSGQHLIWLIIPPKITSQFLLMLGWAVSLWFTKVYPRHRDPEQSKKSNNTMFPLGGMLNFTYTKSIRNIQIDSGRMKNYRVPKGFQSLDLFDPYISIP